MYTGKNFLGAVANAIIWIVAGLVLYVLGLEPSWPWWIMVFVFGILGGAFGVSYLILRRLDQIYARRPQTRVDRILTSLDDAELDALRDRLSGGMMGDGEYGSLEDLLLENEDKPKRR